MLTCCGSILASAPGAVSLRTTFLRHPLTLWLHAQSQRRELEPEFPQSCGEALTSLVMTPTAQPSRCHPGLLHTPPASEDTNPFSLQTLILVKTTHTHRVSSV